MTTGNLTDDKIQEKCTRRVLCKPPTILVHGELEKEEIQTRTYHYVTVGEMAGLVYGKSVIFQNTFCNGDSDAQLTPATAHALTVGGNVAGSRTENPKTDKISVDTK